MNETNYRKRELDKAFNVLFNKSSKWTWPEVEIISSVFESLFVLEIISLFVKFTVGAANTLALAVILYSINTINTNWDVIANGTARQRIQKKFIEPVQHTVAFGLLEDALDQRKKGCVPGLGSKSQTDAKLRQLWYASFAEIARLQTPSLANPLEVYTGDAVSTEPIATQINRYVQTRTEAVEELQSRKG